MATTLAARLQDMSLEDNTSSKAFIQKLSNDSIIALWSADNPDKAEELQESGEKLRKKFMVEAITSVINEAAAKSLFERLTYEQLKALADPAPLVHKQNYTNKDGTSKRIPLPVYEKRLTEFVTGTESMSSLLTNYHGKNKALLKDLLDTFEVKYESSDDLVAVLINYINWMGIHAYLHSVPLNVLQTVAVSEKIAKTPVASKDRLVDGLLTGKLPAKRAVGGDDEWEGVTVKTIGKKTSISKSDKWGMWQHYTLAELVKYCKSHNVRTTGTKKEVIERILQWREADKENKYKFETKESDAARAAKARKTRRSQGKAASSKSPKTSKKVMESDSDSEEEKKPETKPKVEPKPVEKKPEPKPSVDKKSETKPKVDSKPAEKKSELKAADKKTETKFVEPEVELEDLEEITDDNNSEVTDDPQNYTLDTLIRFCKFMNVEVNETVKTHADYVNLINDTVLDVDNLEKYSVDALKAYASEELQTFDTRKKSKKELIEAIKAHHSAEDGEEGDD